MAGQADSYMRYAGANVRRLRERAELTQEELAEKCRWDFRHIQRIEAGNVDLAITALVRVAGALGVEPAALLKPTKIPPRPTGRPKSRRLRRQ